MSQKRYPRVMAEVLDVVADRLYEGCLLQIAVADAEGELCEIWDCRLLGKDGVQAICFPVAGAEDCAEEFCGHTIDTTATGQTLGQPGCSDVEQSDMPAPALVSEEAEMRHDSRMATEESHIGSPSEFEVAVIQHELLGDMIPGESSSQDLSLEVFRREIFRVWRSLAISASGQEYWCAPVSLEAIYQQGFTTMFARTFFTALVRLEGLEVGGCRILLIDSDDSGCDIGGGRRVEALTFTPVGLKSASEGVDAESVDGAGASSSFPSMTSASATHAIPPDHRVRLPAGSGAIASGLHSLQSWFLHPKP